MVPYFPEHNHKNHHPKGKAKCRGKRKNMLDANSFRSHYYNTGAGFLKVLITYRTKKLLLFTFKIEVSMVLHITRLNYHLAKQNGLVC